MKNKIIKTVGLVGIVLLLATGCEEAPQTESNNQIEKESVVEHKGNCLEYKTEYKLDCGLFTCKESFCCERKYDVCVRWDE